MKLSSTAFACFTVLALTVCQFHTIVAIHGGAWNDTHEIRQIADGNPEWAVLANRMLVPTVMYTNPPVAVAACVTRRCLR